MRWELCFLHLLILDQLTRGHSLKLKLLTTGSSFEPEGPVVFYEQGSEANLTCILVSEDETAADVGPYLLAWYYNHIPDRIASASGSLVIDPINLSDGGWYTCTTSLEKRRYQLDFLVVVGGPPRNNSDPIPFSYQVQEGTRVEFPCYLLGTPRPKVSWFHNNSGNIAPVADVGRLHINPTSQSLVILNTTERDLRGTYFCRAENGFGSLELRYSASITDTTLDPPPRGPYNSLLIVSVDQNTNRTELQCVAEGTARPEDRFKWFRNGRQLTVDDTQSSLPVKRKDNNMTSGFYCCEIYNNRTMNVLDTHCVTLVFQTAPQFVEPLPLMNAATYHLPRGVKAGLICRGSTAGSSNSPPYYDPPRLDWTGPNGQKIPQESLKNFTDLVGLAFAVVDIEAANKGMYECSGNNSVSTISTTVYFEHIDRHINETPNALNLTEDGWNASENASITTYMNERVFQLLFSTGDIIANIWLSQNFTLTDDYSSFTISGRVRQSQPSDSGAGIFPVIQVTDENGERVAELEHPERGSMAWQWVEKTVNHSNTLTYTVKLGLKTGSDSTSSRTVSKRQSSNDGDRMAFFSDINIQAEPSETEEDDEDNTLFIIIVVCSAGGGLLAAIVLIVLIILCCVCCCRKGKDNARPMRKITTLVKKASQRYRLPSTMRSDRTNSPLPKEYEIPVSSAVSSVTYATLKGHTAGGDSEAGNNNGEYTALDPQSLEEPSYYSTTHKTKLTEELDEGGVRTYLEVVPPIPAHRASQGSSRANSPNRPSDLATSTSAKAEGVASPDVDILEGDSIEMYEYINADLGPM